MKVTKPKTDNPTTHPCFFSVNIKRHHNLNIGRSIPAHPPLHQADGINETFAKEMIDNSRHR